MNEGNTRYGSVGSMSKKQMIVKRLFDLVVALAGIIVLAPLLVIVGILVKITTPGPILFQQVRVGRFGKTFVCVKFRTMVVATSMLGTVTTASDPRITPVGRVLRLVKLDELPQLFNVLTGKMSFVGPRPDVPGYADLLVGEAKRMLLLRPGITCPASIYFRYEEQILEQCADPVSYNDRIIWPKKIEMNLQYLRDWSIWKDVGLIIITLIPACNRFFRLTGPSPRTPGELEQSL